MTSQFAPTSHMESWKTSKFVRSNNTALSMPQTMPPTMPIPMPLTMSHHPPLQSVALSSLRQMDPTSSVAVMPLTFVVPLAPPITPPPVANNYIWSTPIIPISSSAVVSSSDGQSAANTKSYHQHQQHQQNNFTAPANIIPIANGCQVNSVNGNIACYPPIPSYQQSTSAPAWHNMGRNNKRLRKLEFMQQSLWRKGQWSPDPDDPIDPAVFDFVRLVQRTSTRMKFPQQRRKVQHFLHKFLGDPVTPAHLREAFSALNQRKRFFVLVTLCRTDADGNIIDEVLQKNTDNKHQFEACSDEQQQPCDDDELFCDDDEGTNEAEAEFLHQICGQKTPTTTSTSRSKSPTL